MADEKNEGKQTDPSAKPPDPQLASESGQGEVSEKELEKVVGGEVQSPRDAASGL